MKKVLLVFGTRPEAIKMAPLVKEFQRNQCFITKVCVTAQHREMLDQVLNIFDIIPDYDLNVMSPGQDLFDITSNVLIKIKDVLVDFDPNFVFVHGDTTTSFVTSLASFYSKVDIAHIEAGLRTNNLYSPWPEEANRQITGVLAKYHFAPTKNSKNNLLKEGKKEDKILITGNTVIDSLFLVLNNIESNKNRKKKVITILNRSFYINKERKIILVTGHRRENFGSGFTQICEALKSIALNNKNVDIVYPVHLNPNVQKPVNEILSDIDNIYLIDPLSYEAFIYLMNESYFIITDSGGIQEEAPSLGKPVLVMRDTTERPEALKSGTIKLVGTNKNKIINESEKLIRNKDYYDQMSKSHNPYGDGKACVRIVNFFEELD